jgi:hypothetical protein
MNNMLYSVCLQLKTHMLGSCTPDKTGVRRFNKTSDGLIVINQDIWEELFEQAQNDLDTQYDLKAIVFPRGIRAPALQQHTRRYNRNKTDFFEAIQPGTNLKFEILIRSSNFRHAPGQEGLLKLLTHVGEWCGISPWGTKFGYGKFAPQSVTPLKHLKGIHQPTLCQEPQSPQPIIREA